MTGIFYVFTLSGMMICKCLDMSDIFDICHKTSGPLPMNSEISKEGPNCASFDFCR